MAAVAPPPLVQAGSAPVLFLDANVLLPEYLRSIFLDLADAGLVRAHWSEQVLAEVRRNLVKPRFALAPAAIDKLFNDLAVAFPDALVRGSQALQARFEGKVDPKDVHVAAGALELSVALASGQHVLLVTSNVRHLPATAFAGTPVKPATPGAVLRDLLAVDPAVIGVMDAMLRRFERPRVSRTDLLTILDASKCRAFATALANAWGLAAQD
jgi:hypothetical protein